MKKEAHMKNDETIDDVVDDMRAFGGELHYAEQFADIAKRIILFADRVEAAAKHKARVLI